MLINTGTQERFLAQAPAMAGSSSKEGSIKSDSLVASLWVNSVTGGTLSISCYTLTDSGKEALLFTFPDITAETTNLLLKKSGVSLQRFRFQVSYTGACDYEIYVRAVQGLGESSTRILGNSNWRTSQKPVDLIPVVLIPSSLTDRNGILVKNWSMTQTVYISESADTCDIATAYPLSPRDGLALDIAAGAEVWAISDIAGADIRLAEAGG